MMAFMFEYLFTLPVLLALCSFGVLFEFVNWRGMAVFMALTSGVVAWMYFTPSLMTTVLFAVGYLIVGFIWSFWRYKRYVDQKVKETHSISNYSSVESATAYMNPSNMMDTIVAWVIIWPFSVVENLTGDILSGIEQMVKTVFKKIYYKIYQSAISGLNVDK